MIKFRKDRLELNRTEMCCVGNAAGKSGKVSASMSKRLGNVSASRQRKGLSPS
jgi:hypothetical protein